MPKTKPAKGAPEWARRLTARERAFCERYAVTLNGTQAALAAGYGRSTNTNVAGRQACLLLAKPHVAEAVSTLVQGRSGVKSLVLQKLGAIATTNITDVAEVKDGQLIVKDTSELSPEALVAVARYTGALSGQAACCASNTVRGRLGAMPSSRSVIRQQRDPQ
jgi:hypothetical protein